MVRRRLRKIQFRDIPGRRTGQVPRSGRVWLYEEPEGKDIHPSEPSCVDVRIEPHVDRRFSRTAESILIGASIRLLRKTDPDIVAVQSFADGRLGCGTIYKAANFRYYGFHHTRFLRNKRTGEITHEQILTDTTSSSGYLRANVAFLLGDFEIFVVKTYRYIYPLRKQFRFKGPEKPYPQYEKGETPVEWKRDTQKIKQNIIELLDKIAA